MEYRTREDRFHPRQLTERLTQRLGILMTGGGNPLPALLAPISAMWMVAAVIKGEFV